MFCENKLSSMADFKDTHREKPVKKSFFRIYHLKVRKISIIKLYSVKVNMYLFPINL